jgi:CRP-like cAMP-binding protein
VYGLHYWIGDFEHDTRIDGAVRSRIWYAARRGSLEIPYPIRTVVQPPSVDGDDAAEMTARASLLGHVDVFAPLDDVDRAALARRLRYLEFAAGEQILRQGEMGDSLFLVRSGEVTVNLTLDGVSREVARIGPDEFFGEMAVMTGEVRTASCIADSVVTCYRLDHEALRAALDAKPEIAERLSAVLAARQATLEGEREGLSADARARRASQMQSRLLARIQQFFRER